MLLFFPFQYICALSLSLYLSFSRRSVDHTTTGPHAGARHAIPCSHFWLVRFTDIHRKQQKSSLPTFFYLFFRFLSHHSYTTFFPIFSSLHFWCSYLHLF